MQTITREQARKYAFDWHDEPLLHVGQGESFVIETYDASTGFFQTEDDKAIPANRPGFDRHPPLANPIGGPVHVEGVERGDCLVMELERIEVDDYSWIAVGPGRGPLGDSARFEELSGEYTTKIFRHRPGTSGTTTDGTLTFNEKIEWPITPFVGTFGTAPDREVVTSLDGQGAWGGNLDVRDIAVGNRVMMPVSHQGGLFYLGDVHASQGDTEFSGTAAETKSSVQLRLSAIKGHAIPGIRIEKPEAIIALAVRRPLELAVETATIRLIDWLVAEHGFTATDAYCLVSVCPDFRINVYQMVNIGKLSYVAGAELPKRYFA